MSIKTILKSGSAGQHHQSDCFVQIELLDDQGISFGLKNKVETTNENSLSDLVSLMFEFYHIQNAKIDIFDYGAATWVASSRIESAIKQVVDSKLSFLPDFSSNNKYYSKPDFDRVTRLYMPGNKPDAFNVDENNAPNCVILDLEDMVNPTDKQEARHLVRNALCAIDFKRAERLVRINQGKMGLEDLKYIVPHNIHAVLIPKAETAQGVQRVEERIAEIRRKYKIERRIYLIPIIESALGVERAFDIAMSSDQIIALAIGLEDYTLDIGAKRTHKGWESIYARSRVINAAHAARVQPLDSVYTEVEDMEVLLKNVKESKARGFVGMGCIDPKQISIIKKGFAPNKHELEQAKQIVYAANRARENGKGYVTIGNKVIDKPIINRFKLKVNQALSTGILDKDWESTMDI